MFDSFWERTSNLFLIKMEKVNFPCLLIRLRKKHDSNQEILDKLNEVSLPSIPIVKKWLTEFYCSGTSKKRSLQLKQVENSWYVVRLSDIENTRDKWKKLNNFNLELSLCCGKTIRKMGVAFAHKWLQKMSFNCILAEFSWSDFLQMNRWRKSSRCVYRPRTKCSSTKTNCLSAMFSGFNQQWLFPIPSLWKLTWRGEMQGLNLRSNKRLSLRTSMILIIWEGLRVIES